MNPDAYSRIFAEIASERKAITSRVEAAAAQQTQTQSIDPKTETDKLAAVLESVEEALASPDITPAEKQAFLARVVPRIEPHTEGVNITMKPTSSEMVHIVLFKWKEDAAPEAIAAAVEGLKGLPEQIPGILALSCGMNFSDRAQGYETGLVVHFTDRAALEAYGPHPAHQHVVQNLIVPIRADVIAVDYAL